MVLVTMMYVCMYHVTMVYFSCYHLVVMYVSSLLWCCWWCMYPVVVYVVLLLTPHFSVQAQAHSLLVNEAVAVAVPRRGHAHVHGVPGPLTSRVVRTVMSLYV